MRSLGTPRVLHVLPHAGGGAEKYLQLLAGLEGFEQERVELGDARTPRSAAFSIARRYAIIARRMRNADLVHVHGDAAALLTLPLMGLAPTVWVPHGLHLLRRRPRVAGGIRRVVARTKVTICSSHAEEEELALIAPRLQSRLEVVVNAAVVPPRTDRADRARVRAGLGLSETDVAVLYLGELERRKRPLDAVLAAEMASAAGRPIVLLVAGRGPLGPDIAARQGPAMRVLGFRDDPAQLLEAADVFVMPSGREGMSFALLEAMASGLVPIVSDGPGNPEAVDDSGVVVRVGDVNGLATAFTELADDPSRRETLSEAARERVRSELTPDKLRAGVRAAYVRALTQG